MRRMPWAHVKADSVVYVFISKMILRAKMDVEYDAFFCHFGFLSFRFDVFVRTGLRSHELCLRNAVAGVWTTS